MGSWIVILIAGIGLLIFGAYLLGYVNAGRDLLSRHRKGDHG